MTNKWNEPCDSTPTRWTPWDSSWPALADGTERKRLLSYLEDRFGISPTAFDPYLFFTKRKGWWLLKDNSHLCGVSKLKVSQVGMRAFRQVGQYVKPTTRFVQLFGKLATKAVVPLDIESLLGIAKGEPIMVDLKVENGYVILSYEGYPLGVGLYVDGGVMGRLPKKEIRFLHEWKTREFAPKPPEIGHSFP